MRERTAGASRLRYRKLPGATSPNRRTSGPLGRRFSTLRTHRTRYLGVEGLVSGVLAVVAPPSALPACCSILSAWAFRAFS